MEWLKDYGLLIVTLLLFLTTFWYSLATTKMARVMSRELDLRTKPHVGLTPPRVEAEAWSKLEVRHEIINIGLSYITIEKVVLRWWAFRERSNVNFQSCTQLLPVFLAPEGRITFVFELKGGQLSSVPHGNVDSAAELITGEVIYSFHGVEKQVAEAVVTLPSLE